MRSLVVVASVEVYSPDAWSCAGSAHTAWGLHTRSEVLASGVRSHSVAVHLVLSLHTRSTVAPPSDTCHSVGLQTVCATHVRSLLVV